MATTMRLHIRTAGRPDRRTAALLTAVLVATISGAAAGQSAPPAEPAEALHIVVTHPVLGAVVSDLVGDRAAVTVLMGDGADPHDWSPSARDLEMVYGADLVVANGLDLEEGLHDALEQAAADGVPVFRATDHITLRQVGQAEAAHEDEAEAGQQAEADHEHGPADPHFWVDPISMVAVVDALAPLIGELGVDVADRQADLDARLTTLDADVRARLAVIPPEARTLVTGHESMGYFADRYGFRMVGAVIPGLSSQGEASARGLADLAEVIRDQGVHAVFTEVGTPRSVAEAIAAEAGASLVELPSHTLPEDGSYVTFITGIADTIADALS
jgi:zinc/manganese transport system substrate-binding protein